MALYTTLTRQFCLMISLCFMGTSVGMEPQLPLHPTEQLKQNTQRVLDLAGQLRINTERLITLRKENNAAQQQVSRLQEENSDIIEKIEVLCAENRLLHKTSST